MRLPAPSLRESIVILAVFFAFVIVNLNRPGPIQDPVSPDIQLAEAFNR